ncbi:hypothetical protein BWZ22_11725 [Seonamhaeicola sp. S2-3]|uniref:T9SS type A sorting domain-containing protein n=1 Tax=Seonamhaeicola sp. S2-3 TaxID=1936081 RepID=UPI000972747E|nr:T9SS type A sorting domain-containing protein [Seonamhaeicola sp. S2-3]APY11861.1 hypothetical protein BWZ22_11725 [Seonamhaeicola sp. S2-3]
MKKITFKNIIALMLSFMTFQTYAQLFPEGTWRLRTYLPSPDDFNESKTPNYVDEYVYPTVHDESVNFMTMFPLDETSNTQIFEFKPLSGEYVEFPEGSGSFYQVFNFISAIPGKGVAELNELDQQGQRIRFRGNAYPYNNDLAKFIVVPSENANAYKIIASTTNTTQLYRHVQPDTNYGGFNFQGAANAAREGIDEWVFEAATVLSTNDFDVSSIFVSNPVNNQMSIKGLDSNVEQVSVFSLIGQEILTRKVNGQSSLSIDVSSLTSGMYLVEMKGGNKVFVKKIIKN